MAVDKAIEDVIRQKVRERIEATVEKGMRTTPGEPELWLLDLFGGGSQEVLNSFGIVQTAEVQALAERIWKEEEGRAWVWISTKCKHLLDAQERDFREWQKKNTGCLSVVMGVAVVIALLSCLFVYL